jgi:hypothetical protein
MTTGNPTIKQVNKSVGKGLADAIDKGEKATYAAKDTIGGLDFLDSLRDIT